VQGLTGIKPCNQRLVFEGVQLRIPCQDSPNNHDESIESRRLDDCGVKDGSTIDLLLRLCGGMPATAGRVKMPVSFPSPCKNKYTASILADNPINFSHFLVLQANNRQHSSTALRTTDMWSNVIGDAFGKANDVAQVCPPLDSLRPCQLRRF
jgi:hypothetical protein